MKSIDQYWYQPSLISLLLLPLSWLFCLLVFLRRGLFKLGLLKSYALPVPVIVVGNISVGGTGKTPLVVSVVQHLKSQGYKPGIVSRGYGGRATSWPQSVQADSDPQQVGDEPVLLARRAQCPVVVSPQRVQAAHALLEQYDCDVIISDDGLQHYALRRDIEIVVVDGERRFGNSRCLPAGPLREPVSRLSRVDFIVANGAAVNGEFSMQLLMQDAVNLLKPQQSAAVDDFSSQKVHAVAAIGNPQRFFKQLKNQHIDLIEHAFADHFAFSAEDLDFQDDLPVLMTEKDAVKCQGFANSLHWCVPVVAKIENNFLNKLIQQLRLIDG
ncbi:tetraacyldisaccharide 4'-kinase [Kaarinaea lacus]